MRGYPSISPFLKPFGRRLSPPNISDIDRRFQTRNGNTLIDSVAARNAAIEWPDTEFNGVDGVVDAGILAGLGDNNDSFEFEAWMQRGALNAIVGISNYTDSGTRLELVCFSDGNIYFVVGEGSVTYINYTLNDILWHHIRGVYDGSGVTQTDKLKLYIDGSLIIPSGAVGLAPSVITANNNFKIGKTQTGPAFSNGGIHSVKVTVKGTEILFAPLPHWGHGIDANGDEVALTVTGGVTEGYSENGSKWLTEKGAVLRSGNYIPNNEQGQPSVTLVEGDTLIGGTSFINETPFMTRLFTTGDTDPEYTFFDKSNVLIWKDAVRSSIYYDSGNTGMWHVSELTQQFIYDNIQDAHKHKWWIKSVLSKYKDMFFYNTALTGSDITKAENYTGVPE